METCAQVPNWFQMNVHRKVQGCVDAHMVVLPVLTCSQKKAVCTQRLLTGQEKERDREWETGSGSYRRGRQGCGDARLQALPALS